MESDSSAICSDTSIGKLKELLRLESKSHRDTGQCYDTLQKEYDELLRKYAEAENTIDKLRIDTLRERIGRKDGNQDATQITVSNNSIWRCLYDDLLSRTNKLQNAVSEFQAHLTNHEFAGEELSDIFDRLHNDFENIANAFQSMQALGNQVGSPNEKYPEESIMADDLEGNLYRLGLRLEEIQDEIGDQLRSTLKDADNTLNNQTDLLGLTGSPKITHNNSGNRNDERNNSETETSEWENNNDSKSEDELQLDDWRPVTDDLSEMTFYQKMVGKDLAGIHPKYLSRSFSEPHSLLNHQNAADAKSPANNSRDETCGPKELCNSEETLKNPSNSSDVNKRKMKSSRKSPSFVLNRCDQKKKSPSQLLNNSSPSQLLNDGSSRSLSRPVALTSPEDSGYLEGSQPGQHGFPLRYPNSPLQDHSPRNKVENMEHSQSQNASMTLSAGEQYRKRLDSLRGYINAKHVQNNSSLSSFENKKKPGNFVSSKKSSNQNRHKSACSSPSMLSTLNTVPILEENDLQSSTTESVFSCLRQHEGAEENKKYREASKPDIQREDIETLRNEIHGIRDIVLDLKGALTSPLNKPAAKEVNRSQKASMVNIQKDEIDASSAQYSKPVNNKLSQVHQLQNKQFEMLENLESKLDDIATEMHKSTSSYHPLRSMSQASAHVDMARLSLNTDRARQEKITTPNLERTLDYYDNLYDQAFANEKNVNIVAINQSNSSFGDGEINELDTSSENCFHARQAGSSQKDCGKSIPSMSCISHGAEHRRNTHVNQKCRHSNDCQNNYSSYDNPHDRYVREEQDDLLKSHDNYSNFSVNGHRDSCFQGQENSRPILGNNAMFNQHRDNLLNNLVDTDNACIEDNTNVKSIPQNKNISDVSVQLYHNKFIEIGEQIDKLTSHIQDCKEKESKKIHDESLEKHKKLVKTLEDKLEKLSCKIKDNEQKVSVDSNVGNAPSGTMYLIACPLCGCVGMHQHGSSFFNGVSIVGPDASTLTNPMYTKPNMAMNPTNTTNASRPATNLGINPTNPASTLRPASNLAVNPTSPTNTSRPVPHLVVNPATPTNTSRPASNLEDGHPMYRTRSSCDSPDRSFHSPNIYHHYHTVSIPPQGEVNWESNGTPSAGHYSTDLVTGNSANRMQVSLEKDRVQASLEKASLAALHMENLSKKMLHGIASELFNSGPAEF